MSYVWLTDCGLWIMKVHTVWCHSGGGSGSGRGDCGGNIINQIWFLIFDIEINLRKELTWLAKSARVLLSNHLEGQYGIGNTYRQAYVTFGNIRITPFSILLFHNHS